jgi:hypothetical protein
MKTRILLFCIIILGFCLWLLWRQREILRPTVSPETVAVSTNPVAATPIVGGKPSQPPTNVPQSTPKTGMELYSQMQSNHLSDKQKMFLEQFDEQWRTPIEFYGMVIDEKTNPITGAHIDFDCNDLSPTGTSYYNTQSDVNGLFSIKGIRGLLLGVKVNKEGYYSYLRFGTNFFYASKNVNFVPNPSAPVIFLLRKKGQGTELITSEHGMQLDVSVRIPKDNTPVLVDLLQKQASATGQLEISQIKPPFQTATNWSFRMSIPDGGLIENQDEFQFTAPETGYQSTVEYDFTKGETNWTTQVSKQFYIAFGQPRKYGWLRIESNLSQETIFLTYAINPDGSQNLEPK